MLGNYGPNYAFKKLALTSFYETLERLKLTMLSLFFTVVVVAQKTYYFWINFVCGNSCNE